MRFPTAEPGNLNILDRAYPVGSIYVSTVATDPALLMGFGVWEAFGTGRVLVGLDAAQVEFDALGKTGGAKAVTLTEAQIPSHTHRERNNSATTGGLTGWGARDTSTNNESDTDYFTGPTGGGQPHDNLMPYITVKIWRRTA